MPCESPLYCVAKSIEAVITPAAQPRNRHGRLGIAAVRSDHGLHVVRLDDLCIDLRVTSGIEGAGRIVEINANAMGEVHSRGQGFRQHDGIVLVHRFHRERANHKAVVFYNGELFFPF